MSKKERPYSSDKYVIALTGGIATGKSAVVKILEKAGAGIVDTDKIARQVVKKGSPLLNEIRRIWGDKVINDEGLLNRKALGEIIFSSPDDRKRLNSLMHPAIRKEMIRQVNGCPQKNVIIDIPLLFEAKVPIAYDESWLVYCSPAIQLERLMKRDNLNEEEAFKKVKSQLPIDDKIKLADRVINNSGSLEETEKKALDEWNRLK